MLKACEKALTYFDKASCPFCNDWNPQASGDNNSNRFRSHVSKHLQELSREALPLAIEGFEIKKEKGQTETESDDDEEINKEIMNDPGNALEAPDDHWFPLAKYIEEENHWTCLYPTDQMCSSFCSSKFPSDSPNGLTSGFLGHIRAMHPELHVTKSSLLRLCQTCADALGDTLDCQRCNQQELFRGTDSWVFSYIRYNPWLNPWLARGMSDYKDIALHLGKIAKNRALAGSSLETAGTNNESLGILGRPRNGESSSDRNERTSGVDVEDQKKSRPKPRASVTARGETDP